MKKTISTKVSSRQDPILKLVLAGPSLYNFTTENAAKESTTDCWEEIDAISDDEITSGEPGVSTLFSRVQTKNYSRQKQDFRKRKFEIRENTLLTKKLERTHTTEITVSNDYEESIKKSKRSSIQEESFIDLYPSNGGEIQDETLKALLTIPIIEHQALENVSIGILVATAKLKKMQKPSLSRNRQQSMQAPSTSTFTAATAFRRRANVRDKFNKLDSFDQDYINLWSRPVHDPDIDEFQITFKVPRKKGNWGTKVEETTTKKLNEKTKRRLIKVITVDYSELLSDIRESKDDTEADKWTKVNDKVLSWARKNIHFN